MILNSPKAQTAIPGVQKAAILLLTLGQETSAELMRELSESEVQSISREVARTSSVSPDQAEAILEEFQHMILAREYVLKGGLDNARRLLVGAFGPEAAERILAHLARTLHMDTEDFTALQKADPQQLAKFVMQEHPQTIALVVSQLSSSQAAALLMALPPELRSEVTLRMAGLDQISPEIIAKIASIVHQKLKGLGQISRQSYGGVRAVAELLNRLDSGVSKEILETMGQQEEKLVEQIRHLMFVFEDLLLIDQNGIKELLGKVDRKLLTLALKGTSEKLKNHLLAAMSQRGKDMLVEDMEALGPVKIKEVEAAQQAIIAVVRELESQGVLSLKDAAGEQYVV
ncbi:MAG: flagellar motor switch protein FliG [Bryobacterales bacterium]|nr:flagellar motor switch protein FliG [Bryobacterales bacterium]